jgi:hypothetical protein
VCDDPECELCDPDEETVALIEQCEEEGAIDASLLPLVIAVARRAEPVSSTLAPSRWQ